MDRLFIYVAYDVIPRKTEFECNRKTAINR